MLGMCVLFITTRQKEWISADRKIKSIANYELGGTHTTNQISRSQHFSPAKRFKFIHNMELWTSMFMLRTKLSMSKDKEQKVK